MLPDAFKRLKPLYGERIDRLWIEYQLADGKRRQQIDELLTVLSVRRLGIALGDERIVLEPPSAGVIGRGEYQLGLVQYPGLLPYAFRVGRKELLRHVFVLGPTGTGKSTFIIGLLEQLLNDGVPFCCFDFKVNYRPLMTVNDRVLVLTVGRDVAPLLVNGMLPPPGVTTNEWVEALADIISTAYLLMQGARNVLKDALLCAINQHGTSTRFADALGVVRNQLAQLRSGNRRYGWLESTYRSLEELSATMFGKALNAINGQPLATLLERPLVFELQGLGDDQKRFFCLYVLQYLLLLRKNEQVRREELRHVLVFDESQHVFPKDQYGTLSIPSRLAREVREYGEAIIAATQQADIAESLIANSGIKIILRCDYPRDVDFTSRLLQIEPRWIPKIPLGYGIARLPTRYYNPFLFSFPEQAIKNTIVPDSAVRERYTQWHNNNSGARATPAPVSPPAPSVALGAITEKQRSLLLDVAGHPTSSVTERYERLSLNPKIGTQVKDELVEHGLVTVDVVTTLRGQSMMLNLTSKAYATLGRSPPTGRRGGAVHEYWREQCKEWLVRAGYTVREEYAVGGGKTVDLHATTADTTMIVEIETGKGDIPATIRKLQQLSGRRVLFLINEQMRLDLPSTHGLIVWTPADLRAGTDIYPPEGA